MFLMLPHLTLHPRDTDIESRKSADMLRAAAFAIALTLACGGASASDRAAPQASPAQTVPADKPAGDDTRLDLQKPEEDTPKAADNWWQQVLRAAPNCKSFTDGCRTCSHTACSNIGIACQPKDWSCNDDTLNATPEAMPDEKPKLEQ